MRIIARELFDENQAECIVAASQSVVQSVANGTCFNQSTFDLHPRFDVR